MELTINYRGVTLEVGGDYIQAYSGGYDEESFSETFETNVVYVGGEDITSLMSYDMINELNMLEEFLMQRIDALEAANQDYRANEVELTTYIYTLLEKDTPEEYKEVVRSAVFGS